MNRQLAISNWRFFCRSWSWSSPGRQWCRWSAFSQSGVIIVITKLSRQFFVIVNVSVVVVVDSLSVCLPVVAQWLLVIRQLLAAAARSASASIVKVGVCLTYSRCFCMAFFFTILVSNFEHKVVLTKIIHTQTHTRHIYVWWHNFQGKSLHF